MKTTKIKELFAGVPNKDGFDTMMQFVQLPDEQFDQLWPSFKQSFMEIIKSEKFQREQKEALALIPGVTTETLKEEKEYYEEIIHDISQEPNLSDSKKEFFVILFNALADIHEQLLMSGRTQIEVKITKLNPDAVIPQYAHPPNRQSCPHPFQGRFPLFASRQLRPHRKSHHQATDHPPINPRRLHLPKKYFSFFKKTVPIYTPFFSYQ